MEKLEKNSICVRERQNMMHNTKEMKIEVRNVVLRNAALIS